jgi:transposase-like protein
MKTFTEEFKAQVVAYAVEHGMFAAVHEYGVSQRAVKDWVKLAGKKMPRQPRRVYTEEFKKEVAKSFTGNYSETARKFSINHITVKHCVDKYGNPALLGVQSEKAFLLDLLIISDVDIIKRRIKERILEL